MAGKDLEEAQVRETASRRPSGPTGTAGRVGPAGSPSTERALSIEGAVAHVRGPLPFWMRVRAGLGAHTTALREPLLLASLYGLYELARGLVHGDVVQAEARGRGFLQWEQSTHLAIEHSLNDALTHVFALAVIAGYIYAVLHYVVTPVVLVWLFRHHRGHYGFARTSLVLSTLIGLIGFFGVPTAPPRLLTHERFTDTMAQVHHWGWWGGQGSVPRGLGGLSDQLAAMPSLHVGWALWCGVLVAKYASRRWVRWLGAAYPLVIALVVMATGNHYLIDVLAGVATMAVGTALVPVFDRVWHALTRRTHRSAA